ncbi:hypothetical protein E3A20_28230 [Planctomyces bekefii]|uniref:Uncharacterized protein n=1 Tax=Planctomyces bekefii TaxID=1653850 RepID=A0A5C6LZW5_9PLAN|nr:hypothetical protein E3A20_28230 [Planctomyces bekefii]
MMVFMGIIRIKMEIMNLMKIKIMEGGKMVFLMWEGINRRKKRRKVIKWVNEEGYGVYDVVDGICEGEGRVWERKRKVEDRK